MDNLRTEAEGMSAILRSPDDSLYLPGPPSEGTMGPGGQQAGGTLEGLGSRCPDQKRRNVGLGTRSPLGGGLTELQVATQERKEDLRKESINKR